MYKRSNKRKIQGENTKRIISETALRLFSESNFDEVSVGQIAVAAGVSTGAFYHHFKNKQSVLEQIFISELDEKYIEYYTNEIKRHPICEKSAVEKLELFMLNTVEVIIGRGADLLSIFYGYTLKMREHASFAESMMNLNRPFYTILKEIITEGQRRKELSAEIAVNQVIRDLTMLARGSAIEWCLMNGSCDIRLLSRHMFHIYLSGITARPEEK